MCTFWYQLRLISFFIFIGHYIAFWRKLLVNGHCPFFNQGGCFFLYSFPYYKSCLFFQAQFKAQFLHETFFQFFSLNLCFSVAHDWYVHSVINLPCIVGCYLLPLNDKILGIKTLIIFKSLSSKMHRAYISVYCWYSLPSQRAQPSLFNVKCGWSFFLYASQIF